jgi:NAD dependent epimerase/dehydratase
MSRFRLGGTVLNLKDKKILVTGAGGFIGSNLVEKLVETGAEVRAFVRYNSKNQWGWLETSPCKNEIEIHTGDVRDYDSVKASLQGIQVVFNLAALIGIPYSYVSPLAYIRTNIEGSYNILQAAREQGIDRVVQISTSEVYGTAKYVPIDESHPLQPQSPYSASKIGADNLALSYFNSFELPVIVARPFNTFGPRQSARAIIPTIISQLLNGKRQLKLGNLTPTRDLNFVLDTINGLIKIAECDEFIGETVNIGSGREISVADLAKLIGDLMKVDLEIAQEVQRVRPGGSEVERLLCDNTKLKQHTDWEPQDTLETGLLKTITWLKENQNFYKPEIYNV